MNCTVCGKRIGLFEGIWIHADLAQADHDAVPTVDTCEATLFHGPGHQSRTKCQVRGEHTVHRCIYGGYRQEATWVGGDTSTGYFDEAPCHEDDEDDY